ncbi:MAG: GGDEF domain-containing protein, partial [Gammaproteobacteria bacterium]|nr:GGDEF domain-containing protein [Gammaproteobacteria bacterium]
MIKHYLKSLRVRVISLSAILGILMIAGATFSYRSILETSRGASDALSQITSSLEVVEDIQGNILNAYRATDLFLLEPNNPEYRKQVEDNLDMALSRADALAKKPVDELLPGPAQVAALQSGIEEFRRRTTELFLTRSDVARMYPSVGVASSIMEPNASTVMNAFDMILSDRKEREHIQINDRIFTLWYEASTRWGKAISSFRLYLANQFGSFNDAALQMQEESVRIHLDKLDVVLLQLAEIAEQDELSFEESIALDEIIEGVRQWGEAFDEVLVIHHSGKWREDTRLMKDSIIPIIDTIFSDLQSLEYDLNEFGQQTLQKLNNSVNRQNLMLAGVIGLFLLYALALMFSLERMALKPISGVARALKKEAFGKVSTQIIVTPSKEIQDLVDAFAELQHQINARQEELEHQAFHDGLTGLPNRKMLEEHIEYQLRAARREKKSRLTLMILDLNEFKQVNDELGHHIGDKLLIDVGFTIKQVLRDVDIVARLGGD